MKNQIEKELKEDLIKNLKYSLESYANIEYLKTFCNKVDDNDLYYDSECYGNEYYYKDDILIFEIEWSKGNSMISISEEGFKLILPEIIKIIANEQI